MQLPLDLSHAKCDIDYDSIIFIKDCFSHNYDYLINNFDISRFIVMGFYVDALYCFTVIIDDKYINFLSFRSIAPEASENAKHERKRVNSPQILSSESNV